METPKNVKESGADRLSQEKIYDVCAPAVYGKILSIVGQTPIADKVLEKVFVKAFRDGDLPDAGERSPLIELLNRSKEKSEKTVKALNFFRDCCAGTTVSGADKT